MMNFESVESYRKVSGNQRWRPEGKRHHVLLPEPKRYESLGLNVSRSWSAARSPPPPQKKNDRYIEGREKRSSDLGTPFPR